MSSIDIFIDSIQNTYKIDNLEMHSDKKMIKISLIKFTELYVTIMIYNNNYYYYSSVNCEFIKINYDYNLITIVNNLLISFTNNPAHFLYWRLKQILVKILPKNEFNIKISCTPYYYCFIWYKKLKFSKTVVINTHNTHNKYLINHLNIIKEFDTIDFMRNYIMRPIYKKNTKEIIIFANIMQKNTNKINSKVFNVLANKYRKDWIKHIISFIAI